MQRSWSFRVSQFRGSHPLSSAATLLGGPGQSAACEPFGQTARSVPMPILTCRMKSRSRTFNAWSLSESKFTGDTEQGADLILQLIRLRVQIPGDCGSARQTPQPAAWISAGNEHQ
jgi:hypothetical protein